MHPVSATSAPPLARALAIKPSILILDDTTSAVDMETEKVIQHSLRNLDFECTKIIIAQRISTTKDADQILIMQNGEISEQGTHEELMSLGGIYREVYDSQNDSRSRDGASADERDKKEDGKGGRV